MLRKINGMINELPQKDTPSEYVQKKGEMKQKERMPFGSSLNELDDNYYIV